MLRVILYILTVIFFFGCTPKNAPKISTNQVDIQKLLSVNKIPHISINTEKFWQKYLYPWKIKNFDISKIQASWANRAFLKGVYFAENKLPWSKNEIKSITSQTNFGEFDKAPFWAITTQNTQVRNLPTNKPFIKNPKLDGEGFVFDYLQNTRVHINTPLLVSHLNSDGSWAYIKNPSSYGWIPIQSIYKISYKEIKKWEKYPKIIITKEHTPIYDNHQNFLHYAKMSAIFPLVKSKSNFYISFIYNRLLGKITIRISKDCAKVFPLKFSKDSILNTTSELINEKYGWGGFLGNRDCSALTQDYFRVFGIWIPRNSSFQNRAKNSISLKNKTPSQKEKIILKKGIPFISLIHLKGHIMLYMGKYNNKAYVLHNLWGIHTKNNHRYFIGRAILSDLYLGDSLPNLEKNSLLIKRIDNLVIHPDSTTMMNF